MTWCSASLREGMMPDMKGKGAGSTSPSIDGYYLGIDPGVSGGLALLHGVTVVELVKMPQTEVDVLDCLLSLAHKRRDLVASLELIPPGFKGVGQSAVVKVYGSYRMMRMGLAACGIRYFPIAGKTWQKALGIPPRAGREHNKWKNVLKGHAQQLFPGESITLDTADALLLAEYTRRYWHSIRGDHAEAT